MRRIVFGLAIAGSLGLLAAPAMAAPPQAKPLPLASGAPTLTLVRQGCGLGFHRNFRGFCVHNRGFYRWHPRWHRYWWRHRHWR